MRSVFSKVEDHFALPKEVSHIKIQKHTWTKNCTQTLFSFGKTCLLDEKYTSWRRNAVYMCEPKNYVFKSFQIMFSNYVFKCKCVF